MRVRLHHHRLAQAISESTFTQNHWAIKLGMSQGYMSDLVNGRRPYPGPKTREKLLVGFKLGFDDLFTVEQPTDVADATPSSLANFAEAIADSYIIDREIGRGGSGTVFLTRDLKHSRQVAVKVLDPATVDQIGIKRFSREIRATAKLQHPHVLPLLDSGEAGGHLYYVTPYIEGGSLADHVRAKGRLTVPEAFRLLEQIGAGLKSAHVKRILHGDIKPANILMSDGFALLADFGLSRVLGNAVVGRDKTSAGTAAYVSPEQAAGDDEITQRSDIYSLAAVLYELLAGTPPYGGKSTQEVLASRFTGPPPLLSAVRSDVSPEFSYTVNRALEFDPRDRFPTVERFMSSLRETTRSTSPDTSTTTVNSYISPSAGSRLEMAADQIKQIWRGVKRSPGLAAVIALTLGLGIGANTAMFGVVDRLLLRPPPFIAEPDLLHRVYIERRLNPQTEDWFTTPSMTFPDVTDIVGAQGVQYVAAYFSGKLNYGSGDALKRIDVTLATSDYFAALGTPPILGRVFTPSSNPTSDPGVILSHGFWSREFGADSLVLGNAITLGGSSYTIRGVVPRGFTGVDVRNVDAWVPLEVAANEFIGGPWETSRGIYWLSAIIRRSGDVPVAAMEAELTQIHRNARQGTRYDPQAAVIAGSVIADRGPNRGREARVSVWLTAVSMIVLIIACANVANILLARTLRRRREIAVRLALGISRKRLFAQIVGESVGFALLGGIAGLGIAFVGSTLFRRVMLPNIAWDTPPVDGRTVLLTLAIALIGGVVTGAVPGLQSFGSDYLNTLRSGGRTIGSRSAAVRSGLVVIQGTLSMLLLVGAGLFVRSLGNIRALDMGIEPENVSLVTFETSGSEIPPDTYRNAVDRLTGLPGVAVATAASSIPFSTNWAEGVRVPGLDSIPQVGRGGLYHTAVLPGYFEALGIGIRRGRGILATDVNGSEPVAVVSSIMADVLWPNDEALGKCLILSGTGDACVRIVGIAEDTRRQGILADAEMFYYVPAAQRTTTARAVFVRGDVAFIPPASVQSALRSIVGSEVFINVRPLGALIDPQLRSWKLGASVFTLFGLLALVVAGIGLYSVVAYDVEQRTREIGIRSALGANFQNIIRLVVTGGVRLMGTAIVIGVALALAVGRFVEDLLYNVSPRDPVVMATISLILLVIASLACAAPALRASRVDPNRALRTD